MISISKTIELCAAILRKSPAAVPFIKGKPGMGKSDACIQIGRNLSIPDARILIVHVNNHDIVDFTGVPSVVGGQTIFNPTAMFYQFRQGTGPGLIVLEELPQSSVHHQTWAAGFILERRTATFELDPEVRIVVTGNRVEDRAGAKTMLTHLTNRLYEFEMETSLEDWCEWAVANNVDPKGIAFLRMRPNLLNDFDSTQSVNPTQRSWTQLFKEVPDDLPADLYFAACTAKVGEGAAVEWVAARDVISQMPSIDAIRRDPKITPVPEDPAIRYAIATALSATTDPNIFDNDVVYMRRFPREFQMLFMTTSTRFDSRLASMKSFTDWAIASKDFLVGTT